MAELHKITAVQVGDISLSVQEFLQSLRLKRRLQPLLLEATAEKVTLEAARREGLTVSDEELKRAADRYRQSAGLYTPAHTQQWLTHEGLTLADFEMILENYLLIEKFKERLAEPRLEDHFNTHRDLYARAQLRQIVVATEKVAHELLRQLKDEQRDFGELARLHSTHAPSRGLGGSLGLVPRVVLHPAAGEAVFSATAGVLVGPILTNQGYHLFQVEDLIPATLDDETRARIRQELFDAWLRTHFQPDRIHYPLLETL